MRSLLAVLILLLSVPALAVEPGEILDDPKLEDRAREISKDLRCVVCQNQSIDDSNAELARDMRLLVRERLQEGDSNQQVLDYMVSRYGDFVLLNPPMKAKTYLLWFGPAAILLLGVFAAVMFYRRRPGGAAAETPAPLSEAERKRLADLMKDDAP